MPLSLHADASLKLVSDASRGQMPEEVRRRCLSRSAKVEGDVPPGKTRKIRGQEKKEGESERSRGRIREAGGE